MAIFSVCPGWRNLGNFAVTLCAPHFSELTWAPLPIGAENQVTNNTLQDFPSLSSPLISLPFCEGPLLEKVSADSNSCYGNPKAGRSRGGLTCRWAFPEELPLLGAKLGRWGQGTQGPAHPQIRQGHVLASGLPDTWFPHFTEVPGFIHPKATLRSQLVLKLAFLLRLQRYLLPP